MDYATKMQRCHEYVEALEEERRKIQVFQRELPLCLELVTQAIEACKRELSGTMADYMQGQSECSEQTTSEVGPPVLEEFIPIKRTSSSDEDEQESRKNNTDVDKKKSDWLRSVQLWNQSPDPLPKKDVPKKRSAVDQVKINGGAFQPFHKDKTAEMGSNNSKEPAGKSNNGSKVPVASTSSTEETGGKREDKDGQQSQRKQRRCWSPELHRRFLHSLQQLGGSHAATPKQIRELMRVDGLTNDEVKSHLQKYRLHTRRPAQNLQTNGNPQAPQFVVVGGIWVPPQEYAAITATAAPTSGEGRTGIYAPVPVAPLPTPATERPQKTQSNHMRSEEGGCSRSHSQRRVHSNSSPSTSSSTHTTTASPVF